MRDGAQTSLMQRCGYECFWFRTSVHPHMREYSDCAENDDRKDDHFACFPFPTTSTQGWQTEGDLQRKWEDLTRSR